VRWGRRLLFYAVLAAPLLVLLALLSTAGLAVWVTAIIREPVRFEAAPVFVQKFAKGVYWRHRTHWHTVRDCVQFNETLLYEPKSGQCKFQNPEFATTPRFDERKLRRTARISSDVRLYSSRLLVLGDSHTMGWGVEDNETYPSVLAARYGVDTLNLGVSSYGTARELLRLRSLKLLEDADALLIQYCENDLPENVRFVSHQGPPHHAVEEFEKLVSYTPAAIGPVNVTVTLLRIVRDDIVNNLRWMLSRRTGASQSAAEIFVRVLEQFPELDNREILVIEVSGFGPQSSFLQDLEKLRRPNLRVIYNDLRAEDFYRLDDHLTPAGQAKLAQQIAAAIARQAE
jgi:lysophospholipase L1-like esterase